jgi:hypothetical protein
MFARRTEFLADTTNESLHHSVSGSAGEPVLAARPMQIPLGKRRQLGEDDRQIFRDGRMNVHGALDDVYGAFAYITSSRT